MLSAVRGIPDRPAGVSIGVATGAASELTDVLHRADQAMYAAKRSGGDAVREHAGTWPLG
jgi:GGDEF domain-containing protein